MLRLGISSSIIVGTVQCRVSVTEKHNIFVSFKSWNHGILQEALHYHQPQYVQNTYIKIHPSSIIAGVSFILSVSSKFPQQHRAVIAYICRLRFAAFVRRIQIWDRALSRSRRQQTAGSFVSSHRFVLLPISNFDSKIIPLSIGGSHSCAVIGVSRLRDQPKFQPTLVICGETAHNDVTSMGKQSGPPTWRHSHRYEQWI